MVDIEALEYALHARQTRETAVGHVPVGQEARQSGEDIKRIAVTNSIGIEERRYHHVG